MMDIGKDLQDAYEHGRQDALTELMDYTYGMLTAEKIGLQHKIKSMMSDCPFCKTEPNDCETCKFFHPDHEAIACERCLEGKYSRYEPKTEPHHSGEVTEMVKDNYQSCDNCYYEYFDSRAYPCSRCIHNKPETDMWTEKVAD